MLLSHSATVALSSVLLAAKLNATPIGLEFESNTPQFQKRDANSISQVVLGLARSYTVFASTGISTIRGVYPNNIVHGDIGVSPIAITAITGFGAVSDSQPDPNSPAFVTGNFHGPESAGLTYRDVLAAYNQAAGMTPATQTELNGGNLDNVGVLSPGVHKWSTTLRLGVGQNLTLNGNCGDIFVFQASGAITTGASSNVLLTGGLTAATVYWAGATSLVTGVASSFAGIILTGTNVVIAGVLVGAVYTQTEVALHAASITKPSIGVSTGAAIQNTNGNEPICRAACPTGQCFIQGACTADCYARYRAATIDFSVQQTVGDFSDTFQAEDVCKVKCKKFAVNSRITFTGFEWVTPGLCGCYASSTPVTPFPLPVIADHASTNTILTGTCTQRFTADSPECQTVSYVTGKCIGDGDTPCLCNDLHTTNCDNTGVNILGSTTCNTYYALNAYKSCQPTYFASFTGWTEYGGFIIDKDYSTYQSASKCAEFCFEDSPTNFLTSFILGSDQTCQCNYLVGNAFERADSVHSSAYAGSCSDYPAFVAASANPDGSSICVNYKYQDGNCYNLDTNTSC